MDELKNIQQTAIRLLARRDHSCFELKQKLLSRDFSAMQIDQVIQQLSAKKLLSDERFAEMYSRYRSQKGYGPLRIAMELQQRGVAAELAEEQLAELADEWLNLAKNVRRKRFGSKLPSSFAEQAKQMRFLQYRGFSPELIRRVFDKN